VSDSDLSHFEVSIGTSPGATNTLAWTNVARATAYSHSSLTLVDNEIYYFNLRSVDTAGNVSAVLSSSGWQNLICPTGYIKIPGNETPGLGGAVYTFGSKTRYDGTQRKLSDFCVMKYEAKFQNNGVIKADGNGVFADQVNLANAGAVANVIPVSAPEGKPWSRISREDLTKQMDAPRACAKLGADYSLINNAQWQTIARDVEATVSNWKEGTTAGTNDNALNRGHSDDAAKGTLAASNDDSLACLGIGTSTADLNPIADNCNNSWHNNKRTFALSTGDVIWDFSGNIYEWILDLNSQVWGSSDYIITNPFASSAGKLAWGPAGDHTQKDGDDKGGLGHFYDGIADTTTAVFRGVGFSSTTKGGLFYSHTSQLLDHISPGRGFRCVYAP
jgi:hypothetical protein